MQNLRKLPQGFLRHAFVGCLAREGVRGAALGVQARPAGARAALAAPRGRAPRAPGARPRLAMPLRAEERRAPAVEKFPIVTHRRTQKTREKVWDPFST